MNPSIVTTFLHSNDGSGQRAHAGQGGHFFCAGHACTSGHLGQTGGTIADFKTYLSSSPLGISSLLNSETFPMPSMNLTGAPNKPSPPVVITKPKCVIRMTAKNSKNTKIKILLKILIFLLFFLFLLGFARLCQALLG